MLVPFRLEICAEIFTAFNDWVNEKPRRIELFANWIGTIWVVSAERRIMSVKREKKTMNKNHETSNTNKCLQKSARKEARIKETKKKQHKNRPNSTKVTAYSVHVARFYFLYFSVRWKKNKIHNNRNINECRENEEIMQENVFLLWENCSTGGTKLRNGGYSSKRGQLVHMKMVLSTWIYNRFESDW